MEEQWIPIIGWEALYQVSNFGRVRSLDRIANRNGGFKSFHRGRLRKLAKDKDGYLLCTLICRPRKETLKVHRLVALHFLPPSNLPEVNHKDLNKSNNAQTNLEWVTGKGNNEHARCAGKFNAALNPRRAMKLTIDDIPKIFSARESGKTYARIGEEFGISISVAWRIVNGSSWNTEISSASRRSAQ